MIRIITSKIIFVSLRYRAMYMRQTCLFLLIMPVVITVLLSSTINSGFSSTLVNNTVLQQAQKSLEANQKQLAIVTPEPVPNVVPSAVQEIDGTSFVEGVFFTWVIISSDNELSVNLRYVGDGTTPPVSVAATALTKSAEGRPVTMKGSMVLNAGWTSPNTLHVEMNGESSLYDSTSLNVVASPLGSALAASPPPAPVVLPSPDTLTEKQFKIYGALECNNPNAISGFVWNYSDFLTPKEQCEYYQMAAKIMQTKVGIKLEGNITIKPEP